MKSYSLWIVLLALAGAALIVAFGLLETSLTLFTALIIGAVIAGSLGAVLCRRDLQR